MAFKPYCYHCQTWHSEAEMTHDEYLLARQKLDELNKAIDDAPSTAKPVFEGIARLHDDVHRYERQQTA